MYESNAMGATVSNHYGPRQVGGVQGVMGDEGLTRNYVFDFESEAPKHESVTIIGAGSVVSYTVVGTAATVAKLGTKDIKGATSAAPVKFAETDGAAGFTITPAVGTKQVLVTVVKAIAGKSH